MSSDAPPIEPRTLVQANEALVNRLAFYGAEIEKNLGLARNYRQAALNDEKSTEERLLAASLEYSHWQLAQQYLSYVYRLRQEVIATEEQARRTIGTMSAE